jgi:hypothetical protein
MQLELISNRRLKKKKTEHYLMVEKPQILGLLYYEKKELITDGLKLEK